MKAKKEHGLGLIFVSRLPSVAPGLQPSPQSALPLLGRALRYWLLSQNPLRTKLLALTQSCSTEAVGGMCSVSPGGRRWRGPERKPHDWCWGSNWKSRCVGGHSGWSEEPRSGVGVQSRVQVHPWASSGLWASESRSMQLG